MVAAGVARVHGFAHRFGIVRTSLCASTTRGMSSRQLAAFCSLLLVLELGAAAFGPYGYFIDEPYYLACARRLAWGYVDHPPLSLFILRAHDRALRRVDARDSRARGLAGAATAFVTGSIARVLGGGRFAQLRQPRVRWWARAT